MSRRIPFRPRIQTDGQCRSDISCVLKESRVDLHPPRLPRSRRRNLPTSRYRGCGLLAQIRVRHHRLDLQYPDRPTSRAGQSSCRPGRLGEPVGFDHGRTHHRQRRMRRRGQQSYTMDARMTTGSVQTTAEGRTDARLLSSNFASRARLRSTSSIFVFLFLSLPLGPVSLYFAGSSALPFPFLS